MITNFYTLQALVNEWQEDVVHRILADGFSQEPNELTLAFTSASGECMLRFGTRAPLQFMFRTDGYSKARRNVATLFEDAFDRRVEALTIAHRDRMIFINLDDGRRIQIMLFGPRANVFLVDADGIIEDAFQRSEELAGESASDPRSAPSINTVEDLANRWRAGKKSMAHAISSAFPLFDRDLAAEAAFRAGLDPEAKPASDSNSDEDAATLRALFDAAKELEAELQRPTPIIYWDHRNPVLFSLIELRRSLEFEAERFETVDEAVRIFVRRSLARRRFASLYDPVESALADAVDHYSGSAEKMLEELSRESRADQYEKWGHLLMAKPHDVPTGADEVEMDDLFEDGETTTIPLDPALSAVENARRYYERARRTRRSREEAENRLAATAQIADDASRLLRELREDVHDVRAVQQFRKTHSDDLARFMPDEEAPGDRIPFRRFSLPGGYEVWVGRNARQNDDLTFHHAQKYDLWMHARGVPGSHAVLRKPNRDAEPGRHIVQAAASIAAHFSKARGSGLVPVAMTERKYVTKPKGAPPGAVRVEREEVVIVEPGLPP